MEDLCCLLTTPSLEVYHDAVRQWLYTRWLGRHNAASIKQAITAICACMQGPAYTKILSDHSGLIGEWPAESPWELRTYFDYLAARGIAYFAWVHNENRHNRTTMEQMLVSVGHPAVAIFEDVASAYDWLRRCPVSEEPRA